MIGGGWDKKARTTGEKKGLSTIPVGNQNKKRKKPQRAEPCYSEASRENSSVGVAVE